MTSTIKVDTISENTSANGVAVDGVTLKDGAVNGITFHLNSDDDSSSIYTANVSSTDNLARSNTGYGMTSLDAITTGDNNAVFGFAAATALTTGVENTALGRGAMQTATTAAYNVAVGTNAGNAMTEGNLYNVLVGHSAGIAVTTGDYNTFVGATAGTEVTTGANNTLIGRFAGGNFDTESNNLAVGQNALAGPIAGGEYNVAIGNYSLDALTSGGQNVAVGYNAGTRVTTASNGVYLGTGAGENILAGSFNTAVGQEALATAQGDRYNVAIGFEALKVFNTGTSVNDTENTAVGSKAGVAVSSGAGNTLIGGSAGTGITSGSNNVVVGASGGESIVGNSYNTIIGQHANTKNDNTSDEYQIALGYDCMSVGANYFTFGKGTGNDRVYNQYTSNASWTRVSDERYKKDIQDNTDCGLDFINDLRPVTFKWKEKSELDPSFPDYDAEINNDAHPNKLYGLIAQEVKEALDKNNITDFGGWSSITTGEHTQQGVSQEMFIYPLIKAVQELSAQVTTLQNEVNTLKGE